MDISSFSQSATALNQILPTTVGLDTVRALHQTVVSLRAALEHSQVELTQLRDKIRHRADYRNTIEKLSIENHILRRKIIRNNNTQIDQCMEESSVVQSLPQSDKNIELNIPVIELHSEAATDNDSETVVDKVEHDKSTLDIELESLSLKSLSEGDNSVFSDTEGQPDNKTLGESENDSEEVDDIELIFTTEDTKETSALQEDLVSIADSEKWRKETTSDTPVLLRFTTSEFDSGGDLQPDNSNCDDEVFVESKTTKLEPESEIVQQKSFESTDSSFENNRDESFDQFNEREKRLQKMWSQYSVLVETDISKCGVVEDDTEVPNLANRRNTCPNPLAYRPTIIMSKNNRYTTKYSIRNSPRTGGLIRPILNEKLTTKAESEAQTDISALPCPWKSESYLAHKVSHQFTTLPSKFALPVYQQPKIRLSEKTQEARRVLLSDINFTSMVPELSRSADHLCQQQQDQNIDGGAMMMMPPHQYQTYTRGPYLRTPELSNRKYDLADSLTSPNFGKYYSPSDYSNFGSSRFDNSMSYINRYRGSLTSITSPSQYELGRTTYWRQNIPTSFDNSRVSYSSRPTFGSVPTSPTRHHRSRSVPHVQRSGESFTGNRFHFGRSSSTRPISQWSFGQRSKTRSRVTFEDTNLRYNSRTNHSLPDLRSDSYDSGGDSTDSLVEEAEHYLRRSIDCMMSGGGINFDDWKGIEKTRKRRASAPDPVRETDPPTGSTPYLPRMARDIRTGHWVKVISPEGRVRGGRVRFIGPIVEAALTQNLPSDTAFIGVELVTPTGNSDGTCHGKRYFDCEPDHAIFVPFKKVIMAWST